MSISKKATDLLGIITIQPWSHKESQLGENESIALDVIRIIGLQYEQDLHP